MVERGCKDSRNSQLIEWEYRKVYILFKNFKNKVRTNQEFRISSLREQEEKMVKIENVPEPKIDQIRNRISYNIKGC